MSKEIEVLLRYKCPAGNPIKVWVDGEEWAVDGVCKQCGKCCMKSGCPHLKDETLNGKKRKVCGVYWTRPNGCLMWPVDPHEQLPEGCGYSWRRIK